jgi:hypothetical protein
MVFDVSMAITWILFIAVFPIGFFWFRRAWRILVKKDYSEVALSRGVPPPRPERFAMFAGAINLVGGLVMLYVVFSVVVLALPYSTWSAIAGSTIWMKLIFDFILSRHARLISKP